MSNLLKWALGGIVIVSLGCSAQLKSADQNSSSTCVDASCDQDDGQNSNGGGQQKVEFEAKVEGGIFSNKPVIKLDWVTKTFQITVPMQVNPFVIEGEGTLNELKGAKYKIWMDTDGTTMFTLIVPLDYVLKGVDQVPAARLPNGDPLPMVPGGELPYFGLKVNRGQVNNAHIYLGASVFAIFVPTPQFDPTIRLLFPIRTSGQRKTVGYFAAIPKKANFDGGFYLSLMLPDDIARLIDDLQ